MFTKTRGNAWDGKGKLLVADQKSESEKWPQLGKPNSRRTENNIQSWPKVGKSSRVKPEDGNNPQKFCSENQKVEYKNQWTGTTSRIENKKDSPNKQISSKNYEPGKPITRLALCDTCEKDNKNAPADSEEAIRSNKEEKKQMFKKLAKERKEALRIEKQRKKEDDAFRKLVGPKGIGVTVMDSSTFLKFNNQPSNLSLENTVLPVSAHLDSTAFPDLGSRTRMFKVKGANDTNVKKLGNSLKAENNTTSTSVEEKNNDFVKIPDDVPKVPKPKRRDPVVVDILKAIEICNLKKRPAEENVSGVSAFKRKEKKSFQMGGNMLDSSNPLRHRGKKREVPKKRNITPLKKAIMAERENRIKQRNLKSNETKENIGVGFKSSEIEVKEKNVADVHSKNEIPNMLNGTRQVDTSEKSVSSDTNLSFGEDSMSNKTSKGLEQCFLRPVQETLNTLDIDSMAKESLHNRKFREYCNHSTSSELTESARLMLADIIRFQDTLYANQPLKAESHRRYVVGLRQTQNLLTVNKVKVVIMASDLEKVPSPGGLDEVVNTIIETAIKHNVPVVFPFLRRKLGKVTYRKVGVSCVGILNYQGTESNYQKMMSDLKLAKCDYQERFEKERCRLMLELGLVNKEAEPKENEEREREKKSIGTTTMDVPTITEPNVSLPLLQKLTEMISEFSVATSSLNVKKEESCDL